MNAERVLVYYEQIADAPDAILRLRRFVLDLAVRGKLVPQDANDEPASELLKRIAKEKARIVAEGGFNSLEPIDGENAIAEPFAVPPTWAWCLLDDIAGIARGGSPRPIKSFLTDDTNGIPWIKIGDSTRGSIYIDSTEERIKPEGLSRSRLVVPGDLLLSNSMSFGYPYITNISGCIHDGWLVIRTPENQINKLYIHSMFLSAYARQAFSRAAAGAVVQNLNADKVRRLVIPLPPIAEQHRVVAKVETLMGLCDQLEAARGSRETMRGRLVAASLARLNAADPETFLADARFVLDALPALTTRPDQIRQLRQSLLSLAVRGKLVPQDPNDEPASELLKRIVKEKARLVKAGEIRKEKLIPELSAVDLPFETSRGWEWVRLEHLAHKITDGEHLSPSKTTSGMPLLTAVHVSAKGLTLANPQFVSIEDGIKCRLRCDPRRGDILICSRGTIGRCAVVDVDDIFCLMGSVIQVRLPKECSPLYFNYFLSTDRAQLQMRGMSGATAVQALYLKDIQLCPIPLPPLAEQHRIVAKVDALMEFCDRLEANLTSTAATRHQLLDALLAEALTPAEHRKLEAAE